MEDYKKGAHTVWDCKYHLVWVTKYRYRVLGGDVGQRCRELIRETARAHEMVITRRQCEPRPCAFADVSPAAPVGQPGGAIPERAKFTQTSERVSNAEETLLGPALVGAGKLGLHERQRDG